jgi:hypothetical protein
MNGMSTVLIVLGLFLLGGVVSFAKQKMPKSLIAVLSIGAGICLVTGALYWQ